MKKGWVKSGKPNERKEGNVGSGKNSCGVSGKGKEKWRGED